MKNFHNLDREKPSSLPILLTWSSVCIISMVTQPIHVLLGQITGVVHLDTMACNRSMKPHGAKTQENSNITLTDVRTSNLTTG
jgi:hypothetical protein